VDIFTREISYLALMLENGGNDILSVIAYRRDPKLAPIVFKSYVTKEVFFENVPQKDDNWWKFQKSSNTFRSFMRTEVNEKARNILTVFILFRSLSQWRIQGEGQFGATDLPKRLWLPI